MTDYEHQELERKIQNLERKIDDLGYDLRRAVEDLEGQLRQKSPRDHSHAEGA